MAYQKLNETVTSLFSDSLANEFLIPADKDPQGALDVFVAQFKPAVKKDYRTDVQLAEDMAIKTMIQYHQMYNEAENLYDQRVITWLRLMEACRSVTTITWHIKN